MDTLLPLIEAGRWPEAWAEFTRLRREGPLSARLLLMGSHVAFGLRDLGSARQLAEAALAGWDETMPADLLGRIRFHLGMVSREFGDTVAAIQQFNLFLSELPGRYSELAGAEGLAHFYLGLTYRQREDLEPAVAAYEKAIAAFHAQADTVRLARAHQNLAWVYCLLRRPGEARDCLRTAAVHMDPSDQAHQVLGEAFLAVVDGDLGRARSLCDGLEGEQLTPEVSAQLAWLAASAAYAAGDASGAGSLAETAQRRAAAAKDARLINDATSLRLRITMHGGLAGA